MPLRRHTSEHRSCGEAEKAISTVVEGPAIRYVPRKFGRVVVSRGRITFG